MGTIVQRRRKHGGMAYMARVRLNGQSLTKTLESHARARQWIREQEAEITTKPPVDMRPTLADAINRYTEDSRKKIGRTKAQVLDTLAAMPIAAMPCATITAQDLIELARGLSTGREPATVANYMSHLQAVFAVAKPAWGMPLDHSEIREAHTVLRRLGITGKSKERDRRPTVDELNRLISHFQRRRDGSSPMHLIIPFAMFSTRRQEEITRIEWRDLEDGRVMVRDMKNPGEKHGNNVWCDMVPEAVAVIRLMPHIDHRIFPFDAKSISAAFTRACMFLGINTEDMPADDRLHFHDLRHDGISRLFEMGWNIPHVASVSGHRSWQSLKRYTHIRQTGDKYAGWEWKRPPA